jgi:hypothetical protein
MRRVTQLSRSADSPGINPRNRPNSVVVRACAGEHLGRVTGTIHRSTSRLCAEQTGQRKDLMSEDSGLATTSDLAVAYAEVRATTERLAAPLSAEDQTVQSMPDVSPTKWHRAHVTWFFETFILAPHLAGYRPYDDAYAYIFNSYYEALGDRHPRSERGLISRPGIAEVARYREFVDDAMGALLRGALEPGVPDLVVLGLHHEQQHQELLLMDIKNVLSRNPLLPAYLPCGREVYASGLAPPKAGWIEHEGGVV